MLNSDRVISLIFFYFLFFIFINCTDKKIAANPRSANSEGVIDSTVYFNVTGNPIRVDIRYSKDSIFQKFIYENGIIRSKGLRYHGFPIGKWSFFDTDGNLDEVREYMIIRNKPFLNQNWFFDKNGDTIVGKGSYFDLELISDTIPKDSSVRGVLNVYEPFFKNLPSAIMVVVPKDYSINFDDEFNNIDLVEKDTIYNLNAEIEYRELAKLNGNYSKSCFFGRYFSDLGWNHLRGILIEYSTDTSVNDSLKKVWNIKYFDRKIYVH